MRTQVQVEAHGDLYGRSHANMRRQNKTLRNCKSTQFPHIGKLRFINILLIPAFSHFKSQPGERVILDKRVVQSYEDIPPRGVLCPGRFLQRHRCLDSRLRHERQPTSLRLDKVLAHFYCFHPWASPPAPSNNETRSVL